MFVHLIFLGTKKCLRINFLFINIKNVGTNTVSKYNTKSKRTIALMGYMEKIYSSPAPAPAENKPIKLWQSRGLAKLSSMLVVLASVNFFYFEGSKCKLVRTYNMYFHMADVFHRNLLEHVSNELVSWNKISWAIQTDSSGWTHQNKSTARRHCTRSVLLTRASSFSHLG